MGYEMTGKLKIVGETQTFASGFSKREFVVVTEEDKYPQEIKFNALKEKGDLLDEFKTGDVITVHFDIRGREYNGRHFVDLSAWRIEAAKSAAAAAPPPDEDDYTPEDTTDYSTEKDDVPF